MVCFVHGDDEGDLALRERGVFSIGEILDGYVVCTYVQCTLYRRRVPIGRRVRVGIVLDQQPAEGRDLRSDANTSVVSNSQVERSKRLKQTAFRLNLQN